MAVGQRLRGRYRLIRELGQGGLGIVFLARDTRRAEAGEAYPYVAIKTLHDRWQGYRAARDALQAQALRACRITSPHVVRVYDLDREGDDPFVAMEYVRGMDLRVAMRAGVTRERALAWIDGIGRALHDMHAAGWVHADLKPANVMVDTRGTIRLLDVGLTESTALTPAYATLARRQGGLPSMKDDVYAYARVAYALLHGGRSALGEAVTPPPDVRRHGWRVLREVLADGPGADAVDARVLREALRISRPRP
jgi:serine/threonine protein kinase